MRIIPIMPIESMYGMVYQRAGYYIRRSSKGKLYSCRCPDRSGHVKKISKAELAERLEARVECAEGGMEGLFIPKLPNQRLCRQTPKQGAAQTPKPAPPVPNFPKIFDFSCICQKKAVPL